MACPRVSRWPLKFASAHAFAISPVLVGGVLFFHRLSPNWLGTESRITRHSTLPREEGKTCIVYLLPLFLLPLKPSLLPLSFSRSLFEIWRKKYFTMFQIQFNRFIRTCSDREMSLVRNDITECKEDTKVCDTKVLHDILILCPREKKKQER